MNWRRLFYIPREDRRTLLFIMLCVLAVVVVYKSLYPTTDGEAVTSVADPENLSGDPSALSGDPGQGKDGTHAAQAAKEPETFEFDPNQADSATFVRLGLSPWQASNALKYRRKGGRWRSPDDFARLYGLSEETFQRLRPFIRIAPADARPERANRQPARRDSIVRRYPEKFPAGTTVDLNRADTNTLRRIPGIGTYYARAIRQHGERLGGYVAINQLRDIEGLPDDIEEWFTLDSTAAVRKLRINHDTFRQLLRHPYLDYEQVKSISDYRQKYGPFKGWEQLLFLPAFTESDKERLLPYVTFE